MHGSPTMHRWSTDAAAPAARLDYWIGAVCEGFLEMDVTSPQASRFEAELTSAPLGALQLNRVRGSAQDVYRTRRAVARSRDNYFYLLFKTDHAWVAVQHGRQARLLPGDLVLVDSRHCYEFHFGESCNTLSLELPTAWGERWLPDPAAQAALRIDGSSGFGAALSAFARKLQPEVALTPPLPAELLTDQLGALLALATTGAATTATAPRGDTALRERLGAAVLSSVSGLAQRFPELKANEQYQRLITSIQECESALERARQHYNSSVKAYKSFRSSIPHVFYASSLGFQAASYLEFDGNNLNTTVGNVATFASDADGERLNALLGSAGASAKRLGERAVAGGAQLATKAIEGGRVLAETAREKAEEYRDERAARQAGAQPPALPPAAGGAPQPPEGPGETKH